MKVKKLFRTVLSFVMVLALNAGIILSYAPVSANSRMTEEEIRNEINRIEKENADRKEEIERLEGELQAEKENADKISLLLGEMKNEVDYYNNLIYYKNEDIKELQADIDRLTANMNMLDEQLKKSEEKIKNSEIQNKENLEKFAQIITTMYTSGNGDMFGVLSGATDFYQLMISSEIVGNISEKNLEFMNQLQADIKQYDADKNTYQTDKQKLEEERQKIEGKKAEIEESKEELLASQQVAQEKANEYQATYNEYQSKLNEIEYEQDNLQYLINIGEADIEAFEEQIKQLIIQNTQQGTLLQDGDWIWPVPGYSYISCYFGWDYDFWRMHKGIDVGDWGIWGSNIYATKGGTVIIAEDWYIPGYSYGKYVTVDHGGGYTSTYAHMNTVDVYVGQKVNKGDVLGTVGNTGYSTGPHLHFEIRIDGEPVNPFNYVEIYA